MEHEQLADHSESCVPAFALVRIRTLDVPATFLPLRMHVTAASWPLPSGSEPIVARLQCSLLRGSGVLDDDGMPPAVSGGAALHTTRFFSGLGNAVLTEERILGVVVRGTSVLGDVDADIGVKLLVSVPYTDVSQVTNTGARKTFGPKSLVLSLLPTGGLLLGVDARFDEQGRRKKARSAEVFEQLVLLAATALAPSAQGETRELLEQARLGRRLEDGADIRVPLQPKTSHEVTTRSEGTPPRVIKADPTLSRATIDHVRFIDVTSRHDDTAQAQWLEQIQESEPEDTLQALCYVGRALQEVAGSEARQAIESVLQSFGERFSESERRVIVEVGTTLLVDADPQSALQTIDRLSESGVGGDEFSRGFLQLVFAVAIVVERLDVTFVFPSG